jgi:hypothetical protein
MFRYVITGAGNMAIAVHSELMLDELTELVRARSKRLHPKGDDTVYSLGVIEFVNPKVYIGVDFLDRAPYIM